MLAHLVDDTYIFVMRILSARKILFLASLFLADIALSQIGDYMYRYTNGDGVVVIEYHMPPEAVRYGYEILNPDGTLYRRIGRA